MTPILSSRPLTPLGILVKSLIPRALNKGKKKIFFVIQKGRVIRNFVWNFQIINYGELQMFFFYFLLGIESAVVRASAVEVA